MTSRAGRLLSWILVATVVTVCGCTGRGTSVEPGSPKAVRLVTVEASAAGDSTTYSAIMTPDTQVDLAFRVAGYVVDIRRARDDAGRLRVLEPGALVPKGATLARVRPTEYQAEVDKASGARNEAASGVAAAEAALIEARAASTQAELDFSRASALWEQESITKPAYDGAKAKVAAARAKVDAAAAGVTAAKQRTTTAGAQLHEAEIALGDTELRAPFNAILLERRVDVGTLVSSATAAFTIADLRRIKARFTAPDTALRLIRQGQILPVTVDAFPGEHFQGRILSIAPAADPKSRSFEVVATIDNPSLRLRAGMIASVVLMGDGTDRAQLRIPIDSLVHDAARDEYLVYIIEQQANGAIAKALHVHPGPLTGNQVTVLDGLRPGQRIVAAGANLLRAGDRVKEVQ
jgi:RND family efflux transporter MFP subunit